MPKENPKEKALNRKAAAEAEKERRAAEEEERQEAASWREGSNTKVRKFRLELYIKISCCVGYFELKKNLLSTTGSR